MSETELITKYRPETFDDVVGQPLAVRSLQGVLAAETARSFLFTGPSGTGKTTLARIVAWEVGCDPKNLLEVDAASHSGINDMRQIASQMAYKGMGGGGVRVCIVDECHALSKAAWQALLKPIEDPPAHAYWCLCTTEPEKVPETIKTRCVSYDLQAVARDDLLELVTWVAEQEEWEVPDEVLGVVSRKADGSPRKALAALALAHTCETRQEAAQVLQTVLLDSDPVRRLCEGLAKAWSWEQLMKEVLALGNVPAESVRIQVSAYFTKVAMGGRGRKTSEKARFHALNVLDAFSTPYPQQSGMAPLLLSLADVLHGD